MNKDIVTLTRNGFDVEFSKDELVSLTQLWKMAGSPENQTPYKWKRIPEAKKLLKQISKEHKGFKHPFMESKSGKGGETLAHYKLALEYSGYLSVEFKSWMLGIIGELIEAPEDFAANILISSHNKDRVERAKKRILCSETNKQTAFIAHNAGISIGKAHNDRYNGLYRKTASQLRVDAGIESGTPLDVMSSRDLQMNSLTNTLAIEANDASLLFDFANDIRDLYQRRMGKPLAPIWEEKLLRPNQAKAIAYSPEYQTELPVA
jgi:hypothetical protein